MNKYMRIKLEYTLEKEVYVPVEVGPHSWPHPEDIKATKEYADAKKALDSEAKALGQKVPAGLEPSIDLPAALCPSAEVALSEPHVGDLVWNHATASACIVKEVGPNGYTLEGEMTDPMDPASTEVFEDVPRDGFIVLERRRT